MGEVEDDSHKSSANFVNDAVKDEPRPNLLGGTYIPRIRLRMMTKSNEDKKSIAFQRMAWDDLKKSINGIVNKANASNIAYVARDLIRLNLIRGRGLYTKCCIKAQDASQPFTNVFAALVGIVNTKFPQIGELLLKRLLNQFKKSYKRNTKPECISSTKFLGHLFNQNIVHEVLILEILTLLLNRPTNDSMEVAISILKETGLKLTEVCPRGLNAIFDTLRTVLHAGCCIDRRIQYAIEVLFAVRKDGFADFPSVTEELSIVDEEDQFTHTISFDDDCNPETMLDVFRYDPDYEKNEEKYRKLADEILGDDEVDDDDDEAVAEEIGAPADDASSVAEVIDETETNLVALRRTIYLTIQSSINFEECAHKLMRINLKPGGEQQAELCRTILDWCAQQRTYEKFAGLLAHRFCLVDPEYAQIYEQVFAEQYEVVHRLETVKLRNIAKFFAHLLCTDAISWIVFQCVRLTEEHTTSSSRVFVKNLLLEMAENLGMQTLNQRFTDETMTIAFDGLFPTDTPQNTRFCINFFTSIGLGGLTEQLREHLKTVSDV